MPSRPAPLLLAHRVLVASAIGLAALLVVRGAARYAALGDGRALATAVLAAVAGVGLAFYLRWFSKKKTV